MASIQGADPGSNRLAAMKIGLIFAGGLVVGLLAFAFFHLFLMDGYTNSLEMCTSCHEMDGVYQEYQKSTHYKNPSGVRVICSNCHVPHGKGAGDYLDKLLDKILVGGRHLYHHVIGTYPDAASFEKARYRLAQNVLKTMKERDSKECRQCHTYESMQFADQSRFAASKHERTMKDGAQTCIDCHAGLVHNEPREPEGTEATGK
ncbi:MAG: NapC/NirT family cytochrome c [Magnetococcales bacterium]|nr:NapC/NirT family cytochrome c [Magnetococcales bacterium]